MKNLHFITFIGYFSIVLLIVFITLKKQKSEKDFVLGSRGLNFWLTALSAHASDMSQWLFMAYPVAVYTTGVFDGIADFDPGHGEFYLTGQRDVFVSKLRKYLKDDRGKTLISIKEIQEIIEGEPGISMAAMWYFFVKRR